MLQVASISTATELQRPRNLNSATLDVFLFYLVKVREQLEHKVTLEKNPLTLKLLGTYEVAEVNVCFLEHNES